jgi:drug/metabolite transporter (DMT)-like permease
MADKKGTPPIVLLYLLLFAFFGALGHPLGRIVVGKVHPFQLGSLSLAIGFFCILLYLSAAGRLGLFFTLPPKTVLYSFGLGFIGFFLFYICSFSALARIPASMNALVISTTVGFTALFAAFFLGERLTLPKAAGIALAFGGVVLIALNRGFLGSWNAGAPAMRPLGMAFALAGAVVNALYSVFGKKMLRDNDPLVLTSLALFSGAALLTVFTVLTVGYGSLSGAGAGTWALIVLIGATLFGVSYPLFFLAMKTMPAAKASLSMYLIPVFAVLLSFALLGERFSWPFYAGFAATMGGIGLSGAGDAKIK